MADFMGMSPYMAKESGAGVSGVVQRIHAGQLTALEYVTEFIAVIKEKNPQIAALAAWDEAAILAQAKAIDQQQQKGQLAGIPIAIKDVIDVKGLPTAYGADRRFTTHPTHDANCVTLLRQAGAIIIGKAATAEFAFSAPAPTRNPHHLDRTPGGSSSGSAAGVAAGMFPLALGTQTGGSVIRPAAFCGVYGFKPTFGLIGRDGVKPFAESFDTIGWFGLEVADLQRLLSVLTTVTGATRVAKAARPLRVGVCHTPFWSQASPAMRQRITELAGWLDAREVCLPIDLKRVSACHKELMGIEMARALRAEYLQNAPDFSASLRQLIAQGQALSFADELNALNYLARCRAILDEQFADYDLLLAPAAPGSAPATLAHTGDSIFNRIWSALHVPCLSMPVGVDDHGLPLGVQLIGPRYGDWALLQASQTVHEQLLAKGATGPNPLE